MNFDISFSFSDNALNGTDGHFRANKSQKHIDADTDHEAVKAFLNEYKDSPATLRTYSKECERLLMWAVLYLNKPISSITRDDFDIYIEFLKKPEPEWCGIKANKSSKDWRPFTGPLSESAIRTGLASINSLFSWLVNAGYITGNPLGLIRKNIKSNSNPSGYNKIERFLDADMWSALLHCVESMPEKTKSDSFNKERMRFMLTVFLLLGARISEVANIKMNDFHKTVAGWFWDVTGKGDKDASVAMPKDMVDALMRWRTCLGLSALPKPNEDIAALPYLNKHRIPVIGNESIKPRRINKILKAYFAKSAAELTAGGQQDKAELIRNASAHWLRHTSITQKMHAGIARHIVQKEARHSDARTTNMYSHDEEKERSRESEKHKIGWSSK